MFPRSFQIAHVALDLCMNIDIDIRLENSNVRNTKKNVDLVIGTFGALQTRFEKRHILR